jgi:hypothetical protein
MTRLRARLVVLILLVVSALVAAPAAQAFLNPMSAPVTRGGTRVGAGAGSLVLADNGWAVTNERARTNRAPRANQSWRALTVLTSGCVDPGFEPGVDDPADDHGVSVTAVSRWRTTRITGTTGTLTTNDVVKECPAGLTPGGTIVVRLAIQSLSGTPVGSALLFAAG